MSDSQMDQKHRTIVRLIRENENLHKELLRSKENARMRGANILQEAIRIIDDSKIDDNEKSRLIDSYLEELQGGNSTRTSINSSKNSTTKRHPSNYSPPTQDRTVTQNTASPWTKENQSYSRSSTDSNKQQRSSISSKDKSSRVLDESGFTDGPSSGGSRISSLHESMLRTLGNSTSQWNTQSSFDKESLAKNLFPSDLTRPSSSQIKPWTTTQHVTIGEDGMITQKLYNKDRPDSSITTKMTLGDNGIEIVRTQSPMQSDDGFTVGSHQFKSPPTSSKLVQSSLGDPSRYSDESPPKDQDISNKRDPERASNLSPVKDNEERFEPVVGKHEIKEISVDLQKEMARKNETSITNTTKGPNYTVWDIPNDNFSAHKLNKTPFYGVPVDTSTPIRRSVPEDLKLTDAGNIEKDKTAYPAIASLPQLDNREQLIKLETKPAQQAAYTSFDVSDMYDHTTNRDRSEVRQRQHDQDKNDVANSISAGMVHTRGETEEKEEKPKTLDLSTILQNIQLSKRLLGEIAFQIDRRIINYVFSGKHDKRQRKRLYGYCLQNIQTMIRKHSIDHTTGHIDAKKMHDLERRYNYALNSLRPLGYNIVQHADFSMDMVNKYGLLPLRPGRNTANTLNPTDTDSLHKLVATLSAPHEVSNMTILVDCLALLARDDNKPMVYW